MRLIPTPAEDACISFVVMNERGITDALTSDHHFEQAGFQILLKD